MPVETQGTDLSPSFERPTSVLLSGPSGSLLNWVAFAFARTAPGGYFWTDIRLTGQAADPLDPFEKGALPRERFSVRSPRDFPPNDAPANAAIMVGPRPDERPVALDQLTEFLRLPTLTQGLIESRRSAAGPLVLVVSNSHRMAPLFSEDAARGIARAVVAHGATLFLTYSDEPSRVGRVFENIWKLDARDPHSWRNATLRVTQSSPSGPIPKECERTLGSLPFVASVLSEVLDPPR